VAVGVTEVEMVGECVEEEQGVEDMEGDTEGLREEDIVVEME